MTTAEEHARRLSLAQRNAHVAEPFRKTLESFSREFVEDTRLEARDALRLIIATYDAAGAPPIPSPMLAAIEAARKVL